ncbi:MAG: DUF2029 domain-containing protein [Rhodospirillaceae bacterium]|nr:DUF2029 domain-containing protein [Rhodospirillaceae bacterium]
MAPAKDRPDPWLDRRRLTLLAVAAISGLVIGFAIAVLAAVLSGDGLQTFGGTLGSDYAGFYAGAKLFLQGRGAEIYDWDAIRALQAPYLSGRLATVGGAPGLLPFPYPPFVAVLYAPLAMLPFTAGYVACVMVMAGMLVAAVGLMMPLVPRLGDYQVALFAGLLAFYPVLLSVFGAQNTVLTLLLVVAAWRALDSGADIVAGVFLGLMLFKPQYGLTFLGLAVIGHRPRVLIGAVPVAIGLYLVSAAVMDWGWGWPADWARHAAVMHAAALTAQATNSVGMVGFFGALLGPGSTLAQTLGWGLTAGLGLGLVWLWRWGGGGLAERMTITAAGAALLSPNTNFYDAGLAVLVVPVLLNVAGARAFAPLLALFVLGWTEPLSGFLGVNPLFGFLLMAGGLVIWLGRTGTPEMLDTRQ